MNTLTPEAIMTAGVKRISGLVDKHGITSPEVYAACERWGSILDDVNYPDSTCINCGHPVTYIPVIKKYVHADYAGPVKEAKVFDFPASVWCTTHAGAEANPLTQKIDAPTVADWGKVKARVLEKERIQTANAQERVRLEKNQERVTSTRPLLKGK